MTEIDPELLRELAPRVLGALVRRYGNFANAEDDSLLLMFLCCHPSLAPAAAMVALNRAIAVAMADGPDARIASIDELLSSLDDHHRVHAARAHLLKLRGHLDAAVHEYRYAATRSTSRPEQDYLTMRAARLAATLTR